MLWIIFGAGSRNGELAYEVVKDVPVAELPSWLYWELRTLEVNKRNGNEGWYGKSLDELAAELETAPDGIRNGLFNKVAFVAFMNDRIDDDEAAERLTEASKTAGLEADEMQATLNSARTAAEAQRRERIGQAATDAVGRSQVRTEAQTAASSNRLAITFADDIEPEPIRWLWTDRFPLSHLSLVAGKPDLGKSQFAIWLAAEVSTGRLPGHFYGEPKRVLYVAAEDSWSKTIRPRLEAAGDTGAVVWGK